MSPPQPLLLFLLLLVCVFTACVRPLFWAVSPQSSSTWITQQPLTLLLITLLSERWLEWQQCTHTRTHRKERRRDTQFGMAYFVWAAFHFTRLRLGGNENTIAPFCPQILALMIKTSDRGLARMCRGQHAWVHTCVRMHMCVVVWKSNAGERWINERSGKSISI